MKRFIPFALILMIGCAAACAQSDEAQVQAQLQAELAKLKAVEAQREEILAQNQTIATPFGNVYVNPKGKKEPTAALQTGLQGTWWREPYWIKELTLTTDQQKKMDEAFRQNKIKLIDLNAALEKEELILEPLVQNVAPADDAKILAEIDRIGDARAGLEKANARLLLAIGQLMTQDQWDKLQTHKGINTPWSFSYSYQTK